MKVDIIPWYLIIKHLKRETSDEEEKLFAIWLKEDKNREIFSSLQKMWQEPRIFHIEAGIQGTVHTSGILHAR